MRGRGRFQHPQMGYRRIRHYLRIAWPALTCWAAVGENLQQITAKSGPNWPGTRATWLADCSACCAASSAR